MMARREFAVLLLRGATIMAVGGCSKSDPALGDAYFQPIRYRLTATVETPQGERTAFSVIESQTNRSITRVKARGEAVAVDLPDGQTLFVLLRSKSMVDWAESLPGIPVIEADAVVHGLEERQAQLDRQFAAMAADRQVYFLWGESVAADRAQYLPIMVRFRDPADPKSVEPVAPNDLAASFGPGYRFKSLTVQVTDEPVTLGIEKRLGWLGEYPEPRLEPIPGGGVATPTLAQFLSFGDFLRDKHQ